MSTDSKPSKALMLHFVFALLLLLVCGVCGQRNIIHEAREVQQNIEKYVDAAFDRTPDFMEALYLDSSLNPKMVDQAPFASEHECFNITAFALRHAVLMKEDLSENPMPTSVSDDVYYDYPRTDADNRERVRFSSFSMVKRKLRLWNENLQRSIPVRCINSENPYTVEMSRAQHHKHRLLCFTFTHHSSNHRAAALNRGWGRRCHRHIVITNKDDGLSDKVEGGTQNVIELTPHGGEAYGNMWQKTRATLQYLRSQQELRRAQDEVAAAAAKAKSRDAAGSSTAVGDDAAEVLLQMPSAASQHHAPNMAPGDEIILDSYDYFFIGGDDALLLPENLHRMINEAPIAGLHRLGVPLHLGYRHFTPYNVSFISGAGYVLNAAAMRLMVLVGLTNREFCAPDLHAAAEDVYFAQCLSNALGATSRDTRDAYGEDRFGILNPDMLSLQAQDVSYTWWFRDYRDRPCPRGFDMVSRDTVLMHYMRDKVFSKMIKEVYGVDID